MRCPLCNAPPVAIHYRDCPLANRAQRLGSSADPTRDPLVWSEDPRTGGDPVPLEAAA